MSLLSNITCSVILASSLTLFAGRPAKVATGEGDKKVLHWLNWWMDEACRQAVPVPQLLYVCDMDLERDVKRMEDVDGRLNAEGRISDLHIYAIGDRNVWYQKNAGWISTEALVLPSSLGHVYDEEWVGAVMVMLPFDGHLPALCLQPPQEGDSAFFWLTRIRVPTTIHSAIFAAWSFTGDDRLTLNIPKQFLGHAGRWAYPFMPDSRDRCE